MTLQHEKPSFSLPIHYNQYIQASLYNLLDEEFADFLHNRGFIYESRSFRLFTFSQLQGRYTLNRERKQIVFENPVTLSVHSPIDQFCHSVLNAITREEGLRIGHVQLQVTQMTCEQPLLTTNEITVKTLSPITVYSTMLRQDGRKYTTYFHPMEKDFQELIKSNLLKKFKLVYNCIPASNYFRIEPIGRTKERILLYRGTVVKGHTGRFKLVADDPRLLNIALSAGIGPKGSQGFGCVINIA